MTTKKSKQKPLKVKRYRKSKLQIEKEQMVKTVDILQGVLDGLEIGSGIQLVKNKKAKSLAKNIIEDWAKAMDLSAKEKHKAPLLRGLLQFIDA